MSSLQIADSPSLNAKSPNKVMSGTLKKRVVMEYKKLESPFESMALALTEVMII